MTEVRKESLSALIDGEASEIEVHRLVREFRSDDSLTASWGVYQKIRTTARRDADPLSIAHHHQLFERISTAIDSEDTHDAIAPEQASSSHKVMFGSLALAASLVVAVFIGVQQPEQGTPLAEAAPAAIDVTPVSVATNALSEQGAPELIELDEEKQRRLRAYLKQHDRMSRMNPDTQFVNYSTGPERATPQK